MKHPKEIDHMADIKTFNVRTQDGKKRKIYMATNGKGQTRLYWTAGDGTCRRKWLRSISILEISHPYVKQVLRKIITQGEATLWT